MITKPLLFLKKLYKKLKKFKVNIIFKLPLNSDVIIYDEIKENIIRDYLPTSKKIFVIKNREFCFYIIPILLLNTYKH